MRRRATLCLGLGLALTSCESTDLAPHQGAAASLDVDERRLWTRGREEQARLETSDFRVSLPELERYLDGVVARLHTETLPDGAKFRVRVLVDPQLNAFAMPDGAIYIHTGLLAKIENEAQLATVLAHELTHTTNRHAVKGARQLRNQTAVLATLGAGSIAAGLAGSVVQLLGAVGTMASVTGYSRDLEREADTGGFECLVAAGYDAEEGAKVFQIMLAESDRAKVKAPYFFSTHPRLQERIASYRVLLAALPAERRGHRIAADAYNAVLPPALALNAEAMLRVGDFDGAQADAERFLTLRPGEPHLRFVLADARRKRAGKEDAAAALRLLRDLIGSHPDFAPAHRSLGLLLLQQDERAAAATCFRRYLELKPDAEDRAYIADFIRQCETRS
jgi:predicted Zn-dependent protease